MEEKAEEQPGRTDCPLSLRFVAPELHLPAKTQLHEIIEGKYRTTERTVTAEEFEAFLDSRPSEYTIDSLLSFVDARREPAKTEGKAQTKVPIRE